MLKESKATAHAGNDTSALAFSAHDHGHCCDRLIARAEALVASRGARLTPVRRRVLEILATDHRAFGAYEILEHLATSGFGNQPPVAYRALDFLVENGLAHRIDRLNAFMACAHPGRAHDPAFLICRTCNAVAEAPGPAIFAAISAAGEAAGFAVERMTAEAVGLCPACKDRAQ
ncbi:MAG: transcriptional repressor [Paracoccaceae bacterium]